MSEADDPDAIRDNALAQSHRAKQQAERLSKVESELADLEQAGRWIREKHHLDPPGAPGVVEGRPRKPRVPRTYEEITVENRSYLETRASDLMLDDVLEADSLDLLEEFNEKGRTPWATGDFVTVGFCGVLGLLAAVFDDAIDQATLAGLDEVRDRRHSTMGEGSEGPCYRLEWTWLSRGAGFLGRLWRPWSSRALSRTRPRTSMGCSQADPQR
ncbi:MAG: hypothetical protein WKF33_06075 [Thermoleophilaceae bacterium]